MNKAAGAFVCVLLCVVAGCSREKASEPPVATPTLTLNKTRAAIGSPLRLTYRFDVAENAAFDADYSVFVHVLEPGGEKLWQDDHTPPVPTSQWKAGQTVEYTRTVFVPNYPYIGDAEIRLGLYNPSNAKRLTLAGQPVSRNEYVVGRLTLLPQSENIFLIYKEGWHPAEVDPANPADEWQWTKKAATISFRNPKRDATFYLEYDARTDLFTPPQQVTIRSGGETIATFAAESKNRTLLTFPVAASQFGPADMAEITIEVDRTFAPGGADSRELGIRIYNAFVEPK
ncbi:MAG TPA: hypothetical protein VM364_03980 [Vicinamibacterales bacterium]|nr:hypothetical protein [Vicinamibacterales bacterium]